MREKISVAMIGFGSQGRRIAHAVACQKDMKIMGVALNQPDLSAHLAFKIGYPIYCLESNSATAFKKSGIPTQGSTEALISQAKAIVDCTPSGVGKQNKQRFYQKSSVKVIFQAGEETAIADVPAFLSSTDFEKAQRARFVRMACPVAVSIARTGSPFHQQFGVKKIIGTLVRAGSETMRARQGPVDTIFPDPSANVERAKWELGQIFREVNISLSSVRVPSILFDVQSICIELGKKATANAVRKLLKKTKRTLVVSTETGLSSTDSLFEYFRRIRPFSADMYEVCVWKEQIEIQNTTLKLTQAVDPHSVHIPEVIDAIRALATKVSKDESRKLTDKALSILKEPI